MALAPQQGFSLDQQSFASAGDLQTLISTLNNILVAIGALNQTIASTGFAVFPQTTGTASTATGGAATLPANPVGFATVQLPGVANPVKIPYYNL